MVAEAVRAVGHVVHTMAEVYPGRDEQVKDIEWIRDVDRAGWVVLTKDERIPDIRRSRRRLSAAPSGCSPSATST